MLALAVGAGAAALGAWPLTHGLSPVSAQAVAGQQVAADDLKAQAFKALRLGQFGKTNELLGHAAQIAHDPTLTRMADWANQFETQREGFVAERHKQYEKAVGEVRLLLKNNKGSYALDGAARCYLLADDKNAFRQEPWVDELIQKSIQLAAADEVKEEWLKALRIYSDLGSLEPEKPEWKDKLKATTRRIRMLALYTPDELHKIQDGESKERDEVDALLHPEQKPTTKPADEASNNSFRIDWHESLRGVRIDMLQDALVDARVNYYRDVSLRDMMLGGLNAIKVLATTKGLESAFPSLGDAGKKADFMERVDGAIAMAKDSVAGSDRSLLPAILQRLQTANSMTVELPEEVLASEFADGAFAELDPFTNMIWPSDVEEFNKTTQGEFSGVGIQIQSDPDGSLRVVSPLEDSPAYRAGIKAGDVVSAINGKNAKGITLNQAVKTITGPSGTMVNLTVRRPNGTSKEYTIKRETIKVASIKGWSHKPGGGWDYLIDPEQKIAYLRLTNFTKTTSDELDRAVTELGHLGARGIILDLRYDPGGLLTAATEVCDKFLSHGVIVSTHPDRDTPNQSTIARAKPDDDDVSMALVVLVNQYSASASEIVSGCLKDNGRALIVGERTFGKGSVQMLFPLADRRAYLKLTTSHYYLPKGRCIHREENSTTWGVDPDVTVEMTPDQMRLAIDARQELDVLRDANDPAPANAPEKPDPALEKAKKDPLGCDAQLSGALLLLRLQLAGAQI